MRYENWHKHTKYSNIMTPDSIISIEDIARRAVELGHKTISTVEHGYAGNVFEYFDVAKKYNLKLIFGVEFYYVNDRFEKDRTNTHLLIMAKNNSGKKQLTNLISEANKTGFYHKPRIDKALLFSLNPSDVVVTSACIGSPFNVYKDENLFIECHNYFKENFYLEIHDNTNIKQVEYNKVLLDIHNKYKIPFVFATDTHYIYEDDAKYRDLLLKGKGIIYPEEDGFIMDYPTHEQIFERFQKQGVFTREQVESALINTCIVDDFEEIEMNKEIKMPSIYPNLNHEGKIEKLKKIINHEWKIDRENIPKEKHQKYIDAIKFEMDIIEKTHTEDYFLLNYPIIKRAKELGGVLTRTGRGSAPSFYLNKLLGFTEVDRLDAPITLYPTRFMSISRILETKSLPDIDFNTSEPKPFIQATKEILGEDNCYWMVAYGTMQDSEAFRNLCRAYEIPQNEFNEVAKDLDSHRKNPKWKDIIEESKRFIGVIDSISPHPCANLLLSTPISEDVGVIRVGGEFCALIDSDTSDYWKYLKNDYLTVTVWNIIAEGFKTVGKPIPDVRELSRLVEGDNDVWELYEKGLTATLNQTGTDSGTPQIVQYKPKSIRELSGWVSAIRPSFSSMKSYFLNRQSFSYDIPEFDKILTESDNFILYQENIMATLIYAGFPEDETYGLLKAIAKKKEGIIEPIHDRFIKGFVNKTGSEEQALKVWKILEDAVGYGFNSSHAYSVALDSVYGAYLKAKFPLDYYSVVLNVYQNDTKITSKILKELNHFDIQVLPIQFGKSTSTYKKDSENNAIYKGIASIKFLNAKVAEELYKLSQEKDYTDWIDLLVDIVEKTSADTRQMEILIRLDFFKQFGEKEILLEVYKTMVDKKKADTELYPEFADKTEVEIKTKKNRKTKEVTTEEVIKTIKRPLKYDVKLKENTKLKRLNNLYDYYEVVKLNPPKKIELYEQISFEKENLGYAHSTYPTVADNIVLVMDINTKYTPIVTLYKVKDGQEIRVKINKKLFWDKNDYQMLYKGDVVKILDVEEKNGWKKVDNKWVEDENKKELHLKKCKILKRIK